MRREERAGGISESSREVNMSARFAVVREVRVERTGARWAQAGAPRVLPDRSRVVIFEGVLVRGVVWGWRSDALSSFRDLEAREKCVDGSSEDAMVLVLLGCGLSAQEDSR